MKKVLLFLLSTIVLFSVVGCKPAASPSSSEIDRETVEQSMPENTLQLWIESGKNAEFIGFGTEIDPQFIQYNVGRTGRNSDGSTWTCRLSDWEDVFVPRIREMNLKRIRVMLLPSWFATSESVYQNGTYTFDSDGWKSLELVLDTAQKFDMYVNITMWGIDGGAQWMGEPLISGQWITVPKSNEVFCNVFADALEYLIDEKGYTCIKEVTPYNEPDTVFRPYLGEVKGFPAYAELCYKLNDVFEERGLRDRLKFNLGDDANRASWLESSALELSEIADYFNSHNYKFGKNTSNSDMLGNQISGAFGTFQQALGDSNVPLMYGEFGTNTTQPPNGCVDRYEPSRGIDVTRIAINALNSGAVGLSYWVLFSQFYSTSTDFSDIMSMGLWGFADENYECRPVYYAYSLLTRFTEMGSTIYPISAGDENIAAVALRTAEGKWTYLMVNTSDVAVQVSFGNVVSEVGDLAYYAYSSNDTYAEGKQIESEGTFKSADQVTTLAIPGNTLVVLTEQDHD